MLKRIGADPAVLRAFRALGEEALGRPLPAAGAPGMPAEALFVAAFAGARPPAGLAPASASPAPDSDQPCTDQSPAWEIVKQVFGVLRDAFVPGSDLLGATTPTVVRGILTAHTRTQVMQGCFDDLDRCLSGNGQAYNRLSACDAGSRQRYERRVTAAGIAQVAGGGRAGSRV